MIVLRNKEFSKGQVGISLGKKVSGKVSGLVNKIRQYYSPDAKKMRKLNRELGFGFVNKTKVAGTATGEKMSFDQMMKAAREQGEQRYAKASRDLNSRYKETMKRLKLTEEGMAEHRRVAEEAKKASHKLFSEEEE
jgi:hypothetical protein